MTSTLRSMVPTPSAGFAGYNTGKILGSSWSSSRVTGNALVGGLVGHNAATGSIRAGSRRPRKNSNRPAL